MRIFGRKDLIDYIDRLVKERYIDIEKEFGRHLLRMPFPVLTDIVISSTDSPENYAKTVMQIRNAKEVKAFRKYINNIEEKVNNGSIYELEYLIKYAKEVVNNVKKVDRMARFDGEIGMGVIPTLSFSLKSQKKFNIKISNNRKLCFVKTIVKSRIKGDIPRYVKSD